MKKRIIQVCCLFVLCGLCFATVIPFPATRADLLGTWIGFDSDGIHFYRVTFSEKEGVVGAVFVKSAPRLYRITNWNIDSKGKLAMKLTSASTNADNIVITGKVQFPQMRLKIAATHNGWSHEVSMYREAPIEEHFQLLRKTMEDESRGR